MVTFCTQMKTVISRVSSLLCVLISSSKVYIRLPKHELGKVPYNAGAPTAADLTTGDDKLRVEL